MRKATPPPVPVARGQLRRSYPCGVRSMSSAGVCLGDSQVSVRAMRSYGCSERVSERKME